MSHCPSVSPVSSWGWVETSRYCGHLMYSVLSFPIQLKFRFESTREEILEEYPVRRCGSKLAMTGSSR